MGIFSNKQPENRDDVVERFVFEVIREQRRARRWGVFFKLLGFAYLGFLLWLAMEGGFSELDSATGSSGHTAMVEINDIIMHDSDSSADKIVTGLRKAFENEHAKAVLLRINSPGGSPVQAAYVNTEIKRLREKYPDTPLYAVISDICASGGYYIAASADKIYANPSSLVGSIGVLMNGFGFTEAIEKIGVERRLYTAGEHKGMLDPFSPVKEEELIHLQSVLDDMHQQFIEVVKQGRGDKLADNPDLFSGMFWTGDQAKELGLVDDFASAGQVAREVVKAEKIVNYTTKRDYLERLTERLGAGMAKMLAQQLQYQATPAVPH